MPQFVIQLLTKFAANCDPNSTFLGLPAWYKYLKLENNPTLGCRILLSGPDGQFQLSDTLPIGLALIEILLRIAGMVAVIFVMYGGFKFVTSNGSPEGAKQARQSIINALIGVVIAVIASAGVSFIARRLTI